MTHEALELRAVLARPSEEGAQYFYTRNDGLQNQAVLYVLATATAARRASCSTRTTSRRTAPSRSAASPSRADGKYARLRPGRGGLRLERSGRCVEVATGEETADHLKWVKFSGAPSWTPDGKGFYLRPLRRAGPGTSELDAVNLTNQKLFYHRLGTPQETEELVYVARRPRMGTSSQRPRHRGRRACSSSHVWTGDAISRNRIYVQDLAKPGSEVVALDLGRLRRASTWVARQRRHDVFYLFDGQGRAARPGGRLRPPPTAPGAI